MHWVREVERRTPQGDLASKVLRVVCALCNNEWMQRVDDAMRGVATPLLLGEPVELTPDAMRAIARWAVLKSMVFEMDQPRKATVLPAVRAQFRLDQIVPPGWRVYLGVYGGSSVDRQIRHRTVWPGVPPIPESYEGREMEFGQATTFILGKLLLVTTSANNPLLLRFEVPAYLQMYLLPLIPVPDGVVNWPCRESASPEITEAIASAFADWLGLRRD